MRVGLIVPGFSADQADWCIPAVRDFARALSHFDDVTVISMRYPYRAHCYRVDGVPVVALGGAQRRGVGVLPLWQRALRTLAELHRERPFDVLHAFWATESGLLAAMAGRILKVPVLVSLAGGELANIPDLAYGDQRSAWERLKVRGSLRLASAVSCGSRFLRSLAAAWVPCTRLHLVPLGVDLDRFSASEVLRNAPASPRLVHVAALVPVKEQSLLVRAFAGVCKSVPDVRLDLAGSGPLREPLEHLAADLGVHDRVRFLGAVDHARLPGLYAGATTLVLSSRHEAQGMVVLEAAACGVPTVGTAVGLVPELAPSGAASVPVGQPEALSEALRTVVQEPSHRCEIGSTARRMVEARYSLPASVQRFKDIYGRLTA